MIKNNGIINAFKKFIIPLYNKSCLRVFVYLVIKNKSTVQK